MKNTSVQHLLKILTENDYLKKDIPDELYNQVEAMHKEEIEDAYDYGYQDGWHFEEWDSNKYYQEVFIEDLPSDNPDQ
jgi:hypothetical protein